MHINLGHTACPAEYQEAVQGIIRSFCAVESQELPLAEAHQRYAAETITAPRDVPAFANSQMDGYALTAHAAQRADRTFTVGADIPAGSAPAQLSISDDLVYPIMTGAPLPAGYSCVVPEERCRPLGEKSGTFAASGSRVEIPRAEKGQFVRLPGEDTRAGATLVDAGTRLSATYLGVLAAQGLGQVNVKAPLNILLLTGGDEVTPAGNKLVPGKIFDANGPLLVASLNRFAVKVSRHHLTDRAEDVLALLTDDEHAKTADLIVSSGGISHGKYEVVRNAVELLQKQQSIRRAGHLAVAESWFGHVTQQPGGPQGLILLHDRSREKTIPWLALPGNPVSTLITYTLVLAPALESLYAGKPSSPRYGVYRGEEVSGLADKTQFCRGRAKVQSDGTVELELDPQTGSHLLQRAAQANALIELAPGSTYKPGATLRWYPL